MAPKIFFFRKPRRVASLSSMAEARNLSLREDREMAIAVEKGFSVLSVGVAL
jgi:hypothetical protein